MRWGSARVLPDPAPASTRYGPGCAETASRWASLSPSSRWETSIAAFYASARGSPRDDEGKRSTRPLSGCTPAIAQACSQNHENESRHRAELVQPDVTGDRERCEAGAERGGEDQEQLGLERTAIPYPACPLCLPVLMEIGRASGRERVVTSGYIPVVPVSFKKKIKP